MKSPSKKSLEVVNLKRADNTNKKRGKYTNNDTHRKPKLKSSGTCRISHVNIRRYTIFDNKS